MDAVLQAMSKVVVVDEIVPSSARPVNNGVNRHQLRGVVLGQLQSPKGGAPPHLTTDSARETSDPAQPRGVGAKHTGTIANSGSSSSTEDFRTSFLTKLLVPADATKDLDEPLLLDLPVNPLASSVVDSKKLDLPLRRNTKPLHARSDALASFALETVATVLVALSMQKGLSALETLR